MKKNESYATISDFQGANSLAPLSVKLERDELLELSRICPFRAIFHIASEWILIAVAIYLARQFRHPLSYLVAVAFIGARQHALMILMHDGVHRRLLPNRQINDWIAEVLLAWPNLISARAYRRNHFAHHRHLNTSLDPDWKRRQGDPTWVFPKTKPDLAKLMFRDISGMNALKLLALARSLMTTDDEVSKRFIVSRYTFYAVVLAAILWAHGLGILLMYWFVPLFTWLIFIFRIRSIAEHSAIEGHEPADTSRTTVPNFLERIFVAPKSVSYHLEHHLFPSVPFYRLAALHRLLLSKPGFSNTAHITRGYFGVLSEAVGQHRSPSNENWERGVLTLEPAGDSAVI